MEARLARVEAAVEHIGREIADVKHDVRAIRSEARNDFRLLFGAIIFVALGLAGMMLGLTGLMAKGFHWL